MAQAGWLPCRYPHCGRVFPSVEALLQHSTNDHMTRVPDHAYPVQPSYGVQHISIDGLFANIMAPCLTNNPASQRFSESDFEARVRTFLSYLPGDAANGVNFALDQFRFVHGTTGDQESLSGVALGTPVCIVGVAWVLLRGMESPSVGVNVQLGPLTAWSVTYDLPQLRAMPVVYVDTARFKGVQLRQPSPAETAFPDDYRSAVISANIFALILQYPGISTKSLLEMLERVNISGREVLDRGRFIVHQCQALQCQEITESNFVRDLVSAMVEVGAQTMQQAAHVSPPSGHAVQPAVRPPPPPREAAPPRKLPVPPAPKHSAEPAMPAVPKRRGRPPVHGRYMSDPSRMSGPRQQPPPSVAPTAGESQPARADAEPLEQREQEMKLEEPEDLARENEASHAPARKRAKMKMEPVVDDGNSDGEQTHRSEDAAGQSAAGGEESMDDEDVHADVDRAEPAKVDETADTFPTPCAFRSLLPADLIAEIVAVAEFASTFDELLGIDGSTYRSLDKTIEVVLAPDAAAFTTLVDQTSRFVLLGDAAGSRAFRSISDSTVSEAQDTSAEADEARLTQASAVAVDAHKYGVTELARLALSGDDFFDVNELLDIPDAADVDPATRRLASLARMLRDGRELASLPTAERVTLLRSLFDRCLARNEAWQYIERASLNLNNIRQARRRDWNTMTVVGRSITSLDNEWRTLAAAKVSAAGDLEGKEKDELPPDADEKIATMRAEITRLMAERDAVKVKLLEHQQQTFENRRRLRPGPLGYDRAQRSYWLLATAPGLAVLDADQVSWGVYRTKAAFHLLLRVLGASRDVSEKTLLSTLRKERDFIVRMLERCEEEDARTIADARADGSRANEETTEAPANKQQAAAEIVDNVFWVGPRTLPAAAADSQSTSLDFGVVRATAERAAASLARCGVITEAARRRFVAEVPDTGDDAEAAEVAASLGSLLDSPRQASKLGTARLDHLRLCAALLRRVENIAQLMLQLAVLERIAAEHTVASDDSDDSDGGGAPAPVPKPVSVQATNRRVATRASAPLPKQQPPPPAPPPMKRKKTGYSLRKLKAVAIAEDQSEEEEEEASQDEDELLQSALEVERASTVDEAVNVDADSDADADDLALPAKTAAPRASTACIFCAKTRGPADRVTCHKCSGWAHVPCVPKKRGPKPAVWTCPKCKQGPK